MKKISENGPIGGCEVYSNYKGTIMKEEAKGYTDIAYCVDAYSDMIFRLALIHLRSREDAEDAVQEVFLKLIDKGKGFESDEHTKHWLIRVTVNYCSNLRRRSFMRTSVPLDYAKNVKAPDDDIEAFKTYIEGIKPRYAEVLYLHYYEGYSTEEIGKILGRNRETVKTWLKRAREEIRLTGDFNGQ